MSEGQGLKPGQVELQHVIDILRYCLRQYAVEHEITTDQFGTITIDVFVEWCKREGMPKIDVDTITEPRYGGDGMQPQGSQISREAVNVVWEQLQNPYAAVKLLMPIWPWLTDKSPPLEVNPEAMEVVVIFHFRNNTDLQISVGTPFNDKPIHSGFLASLVYDQAINIVQSIAVNGLDAMRKKYAQERPKPPAPSIESIDCLLGLDDSGACPKGPPGVPGPPGEP